MVEAAEDPPEIFKSRDVQSMSFWLGIRVHCHSVAVQVVNRLLPSAVNVAPVKGSRHVPWLML